MEYFDLGEMKLLPFDSPSRLPEGNSGWESVTRDKTDDMRATDLVFANMAGLELGEILDRRRLFSRRN